MALQPLARRRPPHRTLDPRDGSPGRRSLREQLIGGDAIQLTAAFVEAPVPIEKRTRLVGSGGVPGDGAEWNAVLVHGSPRPPRSPRRYGRLENLLTQVARLDDRPPQFAFIDVAENSRQCGVRQLAVDVRFPQPAAEIAHARSRPKIEAGILMRSLHGIEQ